MTSFGNTESFGILSHDYPCIKPAYNRPAAVDTATISYRVADFLKKYPPFNAIADEDLARETAEKTSAVHWLRFELSAAVQDAVRAGAPVAAGVDHPAYRHSAPLSVATVQSLARDLG